MPLTNEASCMICDYDTVYLICKHIEKTNRVISGAAIINASAVRKTSAVYVHDIEMHK